MGSASSKGSAGREPEKRDPEKGDPSKAAPGRAAPGRADLLEPLAGVNEHTGIDAKALHADLKAKLLAKRAADAQEAAARKRELDAQHAREFAEALDECFEASMAHFRSHGVGALEKNGIWTYKPPESYYVAYMKKGPWGWDRWERDALEPLVGRFRPIFAPFAVYVSASNSICVSVQ